LCFEESERKYVDVSLGIEVMAFIPYELARKCDATFPDEDRLAGLLNKVIDRICKIVSS